MSDDLFEKALAAVQAEMAQAVPEPATAPDPAPEPVALTPAPAATPEPSPVPEPAQPATDDAVLRRIMDRERQFEEQRTAKQRELEDREAAFHAREAQIAERERMLQAQAQRLRANPAAYLKGIDPEVVPEAVAEDLWFSSLGPKAPADYRAKEPGRQALQEVLDLKEELRLEREERARIEAARAHEAAVADLRTGLTSHLAETSGNAYLSRLAAVDSDLAQRMLLDIAGVLANQNNGRLPDPATVAKAANEHLARIAKPWATPAEPVTEAAPAPVGGTITPKTSSLTPPKTKSNLTGKAALREQAFRAVGLEVPEEY